MVVECGIHGWLDLEVDPDIVFIVLNLKPAYSSLGPRTDSNTVVCHKAAALGSGDMTESRCPSLTVQPRVSHFSPLSLSCLQSGVDVKGFH